MHYLDEQTDRGLVLSVPRPAGVLVIALGGEGDPTRSIGVVDKHRGGFHERAIARLALAEGFLGGAMVVTVN
jgi:hypothetical protein